MSHPDPQPPTYDPAAVPQQYSAPPISGAYGYGAPTSVMPVAPAPKKKTGTIVLSVLSALLLLSTGVTSALFVVQRNEASKLNGQVTTLSSETATKQTKIDTLQRDLDSTKRDLTDAKAESEDLASQKKVLADCINAVSAFFEAVAKSGGATNADVTAKGNDMDTKCSAADKLLAPKAS